jgi:hypothetical protein
MTDRTADGVKSAVAIMAKAPQPGQVKTRLCPPLSHREAAQLYQCFLLDKIAQVNGIQGGPQCSHTVQTSPSRCSKT